MSMIKGAKELSEHIGRELLLNQGWGFLVLVKVLDMRVRFDKKDALVEPVGGAGSKWVVFESLREKGTS